MNPKTNGYERVAEQIIAALDEGTAPWRKGWIATGYVAQSLSTKNAYRGINQMLLNMTAGIVGYESPWWGTYKQIASLGGSIRKGEKGTYVVYFKIIPKWDVAKDREVGIPFLKGFTVFNSMQADWEEGKTPTYTVAKARSEHEVVAEAEAIVTGYLDAGGPALDHAGDRAYYSPTLDMVRMPNAEQFISSAEYYSTLFHEFGHSTGAAKRLNRLTVVDAQPFGSPNYGREELVAEFTAAFLCGATGVLPTLVENSAAYIAGWKQAITNDPKCIIWAANQAQKAADLILGVQSDEEQAEPKTETATNSSKEAINA